MSQKILKLAFVMLATASLGSLSYAQSETTSSGSSSKAKIDDVSGNTNKAPGEDVDEVITNKQLRAQSGSKSKWSIATQFSYQGGSIQSPMSEERPNIGGAPMITAFSQLTGDISGKYSFSQTHSLMAGIGLRYVTPFQRSGTPGQLKPNGQKAYDGNKIDADNPYLTYQYIYKVGGVQNMVQAQALYYTASDWKNHKYTTTETLSQTSAYELGQTGLTLGLYTALQGNTFTQDLAGQNDVSFAIDPYLEYTINDTFNLRTVFNLWNYDHSRAQGFDTWAHEDLVQSFGVGISLTRDIFLYPNVQFILDNIRADQTNVALNAYINVF